ncbi:MAG: FG-GAP-like repeat-containing protein, partial [Candidatus Cloacimonetes bacterium]|nr:FG-GAP-like repeat-containing protein [Candidatus Cloacimonadota bacterium]
MKKFVIILFVLVSAILFAQEYNEYNEFGWGQDMSRSKPAFIDIDNDGLLDMIVGEQDGDLSHYEQSAAGSTEFVLITTTFDDINVGEYPTPTFTDIDNDGLLDLIIGERAGNLNHYEQQSIGSYEFGLIATNFNSIDVGSESVPTFTDIDNDGLLDMIVGEFFGNLNHYEQFAVGSSNFTLLTTNFNGIDVGFRSAPSFIDFDEDGVLDMIVGEQNGNLNHYQQSALNPNTFTLITSSFNSIDVGFKSFAVFIDIDNNNLIDMMIGEQDGNLNHYEQISTHSDEFVIITPIFAFIDVGNNSIPIFSDIDNDGLLDMLIGNNDGYLVHYEQTVIGSDEFGLITNSFNNIDVGNNSAPTLTDLNNDGLLDLIIGEYDGNLNHYEQSAVGSNEFVLMSTSFINSINVGSYSTPSFTDINNDGLLDLIIGEDSGYLYHYEQDAEGSFEFVLITTSFNNIDIGTKSTPIFTDIDHNGLLDLIIGEEDGNLNHYEQTAFDSVEFNLITNSFRSINVESNSTPTFIDIDNDGWEDLFMGTINGGVHYYQIVPPDVILYADFVTLDTLVVIGQQVQFTDLSTADYTLMTSWEWDFDFDGIIDSTGQTPNWTYLVPGEYTVSL